MHLCRHVLSMRYLNVDGMVTANEFSEDRVIQDLENSGIHVDLNSPARHKQSSTFLGQAKCLSCSPRGASPYPPNLHLSLISFNILKSVGDTAASSKMAAAIRNTAWYSPSYRGCCCWGDYEESNHLQNSVSDTPGSN
jgi:hypothetical protein